jgi:hypothetical protein
MKKMIFIVLFFCSCNNIQQSNKDSEQKRIYIKTISVNGFDVNWYVYSLLSSLSPGKIELIKNHKSYEVVSSHYISNITAQSDTLKIQFYDANPVYMGIDTLELRKANLPIIIDSSGQSYNDAEVRLDRLITRHTDVNKPHHENTDSKTGGYDLD